MNANIRIMSNTDNYSKGRFLPVLLKLYELYNPSCPRIRISHATIRGEEVRRQPNLVRANERNET